MARVRIRSNREIDLIIPPPTLNAIEVGVICRTVVLVPMWTFFLSLCCCNLWSQKDHKSNGSVASVI